MAHVVRVVDHADHVDRAGHADIAEPAFAPAQAVVEHTPQPAATPPAITAPVVVLPPAKPFALPTSDLHSLAAAAGLEWVNSDADKIRTVQAAMAAEPAPIRLPREPKPVMVVEHGPLVLVETRKDLSQLKLPFDTARDAVRDDARPNPGA